MFLAGGIGNVFAQDKKFPIRSIELIVATPPGGGNDISARLLAEVMSPSLGQKIIIVNKPGASQTLGINETVRGKTGWSYDPHSIQRPPEMDIVLMGFFGLIGYLLRKFGFDLPILIMGVVLGDRIETACRRALSISQGDLLVFFQSSFSKIFIIAALAIVVLQLTAWLMGFRIRETESKT
jgi:hypothetical protein